MRAYYLFAIIALASGTVSRPAMAQGNPDTADLRIADDEVARQAGLVRQAVQQGDPASIAVARAKFQAAQAIAWGKRHPAKAPTTQVSAN